MKNKILKLAVISFIGIILLNSCQKEGCTDSDSRNYDSKAKKDDGTCRYIGEFVFWYGKNTSDNLYADASEELYFYVDDKLEYTVDALTYWSSTPNCGDNSSLTVSKSWGNANSKSFSYKVYDDFDDLIWSGNVTFIANTCYALELVY